MSPASIVSPFSVRTLPWRGLLPAAVLVLATALPAMAGQNWVVDPSRTRIGFSIDAVGWPRTEGQFRRFSGRLSIDFDHPSRSRVEFTVDAASVDAGSSSLSGLISGAAFLNASRYPKVTFVSNDVEKVDSRTARVTGELTLLGVTRSVTIDVEVEPKSAGRKQLGFRANWSILRSEFGMNSGQPLISNKVNLTVTTEAAEREGT